MMKKALITASMGSMLDNFNRNNIDALIELGYKVTLAANFDAVEDSNPQLRLQKFKEEMENRGCKVIQIDFTRKLSNISKQRLSYKQLKELAREDDYQLVHCNSPICAAMTRLIFKNKRKRGTKVIYTAHGFHFFSGAPIKNWLFYFPVEWICSRWTDVLNTMNQEDYRWARKLLKAKKVVYIPGVGIDMEKFQAGSVERRAVRERLGIVNEEKMILSVGELSRRKNQIKVIKALKYMNSSGIKYFICGRGELEDEIKAVIKKENLEKQVILLGYREDISDICQAADLFVFPSLQEGLPMALLEAIATKTPVVCSDIRGNRELVYEKEFLFDPRKESEIAACMQRAFHTDMSKIIEKRYKRIQEYSVKNVMRLIREEYKRQEASLSDDI